VNGETVGRVVRRWSWPEVISISGSVISGNGRAQT